MLHGLFLIAFVENALVASSLKKYHPWSVFKVRANKSETFT